MVLIMASFLLPVADMVAQELHQVQAVVDGIRSPRHAAQADALLRQQEGVAMSRTDHQTRNLLIHVEAGTPIGPTELNAWLSPLGMSVRCHRRNAVNASTFRHLDPRTCGAAPQPPR